MSGIFSILGTALIVLGLTALLYWALRASLKSLTGGCHGNAEGQCPSCHTSREGDAFPTCHQQNTVITKKEPESSFRQ